MFPRDDYNSLGLALVLGLAATAADAALTERDALAEAFPGATFQTETVRLAPAQIAKGERLAAGKLASAECRRITAVRDGRVVGHAYVDTHKVRSMPETVLTAVEPDGRLRRVLLLQFNDHKDYEPPERWLRRFDGLALNEELQVDKAVKLITGSTMSVRALLAAVRRALAVEAVLTGGAA